MGVYEGSSMCGEGVHLEIVNLTLTLTVIRNGTCMPGSAGSDWGTEDNKDLRQASNHSPSIQIPAPTRSRRALP